MTASGAADPVVAAVAEALREQATAWWQTPPRLDLAAEVAVATHRRAVLAQTDDRARLARLAERAERSAEVHPAESASEVPRPRRPPVNPLVYARDVRYLLAALSDATARTEQAERRAVAAQSRASEHCARAEEEEESWRLVKGELDAALATRDEALARLEEAEALGRSEGKAERDRGWRP